MNITLRTAAVATAACLAISSAWAAPKHHAKAAAAATTAAACVQGADETALQVRVVQTDLMVAALSCNATARYNDFVKQNQPTLMAAHTQLGKFFNGKRGGEKALNIFITKLANDSSKRSIANIAQFCQETGWLYDAVLSPKHGDFNAFVGRLAMSQRHGFTPCSTPATYVVLGPNGATEVAAATPVAPAAAAASPTAPSNPPPAPAAGKAKGKTSRVASDD